MDRSFVVRTPESVGFSYDLAGLGSRALAVMLDLLIQITGLTLITLAVILGAAQLHLANLFAKSIVIAVSVTVLFLVLFGYFILFEAFWNGQTPGKRLLHLRVVRDGGHPTDLGASLVRNLVRVGEMMLGFYAISAVIALLSSENKRLGDYAAGTIVVRESRYEAPGGYEMYMQPNAGLAATAYVSAQERAVLHDFLTRRATLELTRRMKFAHQFAEMIRPRLPEEWRTLGDEALLERLG